MVADIYNVSSEYFMVGDSLSTRKMNVHHWDTYKILIQEFAATILNTQIPDPNEQQEDYTQDIVSICRSTQPFTIYPEGNAFRIRKWVGAVYIDMFCDPDNNTIMYYVL